MIEYAIAIYCHAEIRIDGIWHHYNTLDIGRDDNLFSCLAGLGSVDTGISAKFPVRGLPKDVSPVTRLEAQDFGDYGHTHSWIGLEEIWRVLDDFPDILCRAQRVKANLLFGFSYSACSNNFPDELQDVRWVFWFE
jgi:hypothetical protein